MNAVAFPILFPFRIGFLHTEIAKVAKTDLDWMTLRSVVRRFLCDLCDLCVDGLF